jgi:HEPN domain-containing protein
LLSTNDPDLAEIWIEVLSWIRVATSDMRAVRICLSADPPLCDIAAYHCQQASEKLLKGFLVRANRDFGKTHNLGKLADAVVTAFPAVDELVEPLRDWTLWSVAYRYPGTEQDELEPSADGLHAALEAIEQVWAALLSLAPH